MCGQSPLSCSGPERDLFVGDDGLGCCRRLYNAFVLANTLANTVAALHLAYFVFVVASFVCIILGAVEGWSWIRNPWFRIAHAVAIAVVVMEDAIQVNCPLNVLEHGLRATPVVTQEASTGFGWVLDGLLFHTIPGSVLIPLWRVFGALVVVLMFAVPPRPAWPLAAR